MASSLASNNQSNQFTLLAARIIPLIELNFNLQTLSKYSNANTKIRARILPKQIRPCYIFAPETLSWLKASAISTSTESEVTEANTYNGSFTRYY